MGIGIGVTVVVIRGIEVESGIVVSSLFLLVVGMKLVDVEIIRVEEKGDVEVEVEIEVGVEIEVEIEIEVEVEVEVGVEIVAKVGVLVLMLVVAEQGSNGIGEEQSFIFSQRHP